MFDVVHRIAVLLGDGIGLEVVPRRSACSSGPAGSTALASSGKRCPGAATTTGRRRDDAADGLQLLRGYDAIFLGAVGAPEVPDHISLWGLLIPSACLDQYLALRPIRWMPGVPSPLSGNASIDIVVVRGTWRASTPRLVVDVSRPAERAGFPAGDPHPARDRTDRAPGLHLAEQRQGRLVSATKSKRDHPHDAVWDEVVEEVAGDHPTVEVEKVLIDALGARVVSAPETLDVIVASNLFGDILTDLTAAVAGSIGIAPNANLNPEREHPSMFEPVHGSAPDIAGQGIANPIGQVWTGALLLEHLGEASAAAAVHGAIERTLEFAANHTRDFGGRAGTEAGRCFGGGARLVPPRSIRNCNYKGSAAIAGGSSTFCVCPPRKSTDTLARDRGRPPLLPQLSGRRNRGLASGDIPDRRGVEPLAPIDSTTTRTPWCPLGCLRFRGSGRWIGPDGPPSQGGGTRPGPSEVAGHFHRRTSSVGTQARGWALRP